MKKESEWIELILYRSHQAANTTLMHKACQQHVTLNIIKHWSHAETRHCWQSSTRELIFYSCYVMSSIHSVLTAAECMQVCITMVVLLCHEGLQGNINPSKQETKAHISCFQWGIILNLDTNTSSVRVNVLIFNSLRWTQFPVIMSYNKSSFSRCHFVLLLNYFINNLIYYDYLIFIPLR